MSCGAREFQVFIENASRNAVNTSRGRMVDFIEALGTWVEEKRLQKASVFSVMADDCTDIRQWRNCQFSVSGRKMALLLMLFGHCAFKESRC